jgi:enoyl-CoA hydratase/carnithine racemase
MGVKTWDSPLWTTETRGPVLVATYSNGPRNYLVPQALDELEELVAEWRNPEYKAIVIQSAAGTPGFMTHYSVEELHGLISSPETSRYAAALVRRYKGIFDDLSALPKIVIAAMNGDTMGGGFELALACDLRIGEDGDYRYGHPEIKVGIIPGAGGTQRLPRLIGMSRAADFILRSKIVRPDVALAMDIVHEVVDDAPARALEIAQEIAGLPPMAVANAKIALYLGNDSTIQAGFEVENCQWIETMQSDDARLAMKTYIDLPFEKRRDWFEGTGHPTYAGH